MTLSELKELAQSATPGKVISHDQEYDSWIAIVDEKTKAVSPLGSFDKPEDAKYYAAMNPAIALRMIELLERAKNYIECECWDFKPEICPICTWLKDLEEL